MNEENTGEIGLEKPKNKGKVFAERSAKECAYLAVFVALLIVVQLVFSAVPGVEAVTVLLVSYAFVFGVRRGVIAAAAFALLRQIVFGFSPTVLILYLVYYPALSAAFGGFGHAVKKPLFSLWWLVLVACVCTATFTMIDNVITPLWYGYSKRALKIYFYALFLYFVFC